jgi:hypothetical protein
VIVTEVPPAAGPVFGLKLVISGVATTVVLVVLVELVVELVVVDEVDVVLLVVVVDVEPGAVVELVLVEVEVVVVGSVGSGAMTTGSPRRILTYSPTVISGCHLPCLQTST